MNTAVLSGFASQPPLAEAPPAEGFLRLYRAFLVARAALALALCGVQLAGRAGIGEREPSPLVLPLCLIYLGLSLLQLGLPRLQRGVSRQSLSALSQPLWWASTGVDLALFTALAMLASHGAPVAALYVMPVMMSAVLANRRAGLAAAALATLGLLGSSLWVNLIAIDWGPSLTQAGLAGVGYFAIALLASELATRLAREEAAARAGRAQVQQQQALNQLVIAEMREGVLVVDRKLQVQAANPAARVLLGERVAVQPAQFPLDGEPAWTALASAAEAAWRDGEAGEPRDVVLGFAQAPARTLRLRLRWMHAAAGGDDLLLLLFEDRATLMARARHDKLASMGRMSAGIAHEIRNPLAAISQANALLAEDLGADAGGQRLTALVASNVQRLQRIVDEVMLLAAPIEAAPPVMELRVALTEVLDDWQRTQGLFGAQALQRQLPPGGALPVFFEPDHLRRVLLNLLDNGWRHAQPAPRPWLWVQLKPLGEQLLQLSVLNPSPPLPPEVEKHLFEPFYSTRSRGAGLGLSICRELCERYGARIDYQAQSHEGEPAVAFVVQLRRAPAKA